MDETDVDSILRGFDPDEGDIDAIGAGAAHGSDEVLDGWGHDWGPQLMGVNLFETDYQVWNPVDFHLT
jgi:hypothetical protein